MTLTGLFFLGAFAVTCTLAVARHPIFGIIAYISLVFLDPSSRWWGQGLPGFRWSLIAVAVTLLAFAIHRPARSTLPIRGHAAWAAMLVFLAYVLAQSPWAADSDLHWFLFDTYWKYVLATYLIYRCVDSERHLYYVIWTIVFGAAYLSWIANSYFAGGRFDDFGGAGIDEANAGGLTIALGIFLAASLFLTSDNRLRVVLLLILPFMVNAVIMTVSRSTFLALIAGGLTFNLYTPRRFRARVLALSVLSVVLFAMLADPSYWLRMGTLSHRGADIEGVDTGKQRVAVFNAQLEIAPQHPMGCGHRCTDTLAPHYVEERFLVEGGTVSSHNTTMSMIVDHGVVGGLIYAAFVIWGIRSIRNLAKSQKADPTAMGLLIPGVAACIVGQFVADQFVPYVRYEPRYWLLVIVMIMLNLRARRAEAGLAHSGTDRQGILGAGDPEGQRS